MGWYTSVRNCINEPEISSKTKKSIISGYKEAVEYIVDEVINFNKNSKKPCIIAIDGYIGARFEKLARKISESLKVKDGKSEVIDINVLYGKKKELDDFAKEFLTDDPSFGIVCTNHWLSHIMDSTKVKDFKNKILSLKQQSNHNNKLAAIICFGCGSAVSDLKTLYNKIIYLDVTRETIVDRLGRSEIVPIGSTQAEPIFWKHLYYVDYPMLAKQKKYVMQFIDYYIDDNTDNLKLVPKKSYDEIITQVVKYPLKFKKIFMTGPWGGMYFRKYYNMPELANMCWNIEVSGMDSSLPVDVGITGDFLDLPFYNIYSRYPVEVIGPYCTKKYPGNFPIQVGLQDGYFPEPVPHERRAMPLHLHPDTNYVKKNFKESVGRYEVYYIAKTYENANTMHGFYQDADLEEYRKKVVEAEQKKMKFDWDKYVKC